METKKEIHGKSHNGSFNGHLIMDDDRQPFTNQLVLECFSASSVSISFHLARSHRGNTAGDWLIAGSCRILYDCFVLIHCVHISLFFIVVHGFDTHTHMYLYIHKYYY